MRGAGAVIEVQGVTVGHGCGVAEADGLGDGLGVTSAGIGDGLDELVPDGDGDSEAIDGRGIGEPRPWIARAMLPAARMRMEAGIAQRRGC